VVVAWLERDNQRAFGGPTSSLIEGDNLSVRLPGPNVSAFANGLTVFVQHHAADGRVGAGGHPTASAQSYRAIHGGFFRNKSHPA
jgi:hypothetical protein